MTCTNNFVSLNLTNLEKSILNSSCVLKLYCEKSNIRVVRLETADGKLVASGKGFSIIPNLEKLSKQELKIGYELPFSPKIVDTKLDYQLLSGATVTIERISSNLLSGIVKDWYGTILFTTRCTNLSFLLSIIERHFQ